MINKRILIKNLLAYTAENTFLDKKRQLNLHYREGKSKFIKHICALSNSNPENNSYMIIGVEDADNQIVGVDFFDDSRIQNLVNAYLNNPPNILYENVSFPHLPKNKVVGLVTIKPKKGITTFKKNIFNITAGDSYIRVGSNSLKLESNEYKVDSNKEIVESIEKNSRNSIEENLNSVLDFMNERHRELNPKFKVFKELFIICWAGIEKEIDGKNYLSRVDIELINEQVRIYYSTYDKVIIEFTDDYFLITEYVGLKFNETTKYCKFEQVKITFLENGYYSIDTEIVFNPPKLNESVIQELYDNQLKLIEEQKNKDSFDVKALRNYPFNMMILYLNGIRESKKILIENKDFLKSVQDEKVYESFKFVMRIFRKIKYEVNEQN